VIYFVGTENKGRGGSTMVRIAICEDELEQVQLVSDYVKAMKPHYPDIK